MPTGPYGWQAKLGIGATSTVDKPLRFVNESFQATRLIIPDDEITGSRDADIGQARYGPFSYIGSITLRPTAVEWSYILEWILGGTPVGTSYPIADTIVSRYMSIDRVTKVFLYDGVVVGRATINFVAGAKGTCTLDLFATGETVGNAGTFPSLTLDTTTKAFILQDNVISVNSVAVCTTSITIVIDNLLTPDEFTNCVTGPAEMVPAGPRDIRLSFTPAYDTTHSALYPPTDAGWAVTVVATNGTVSLSFSFVKVVFDRKSPTVPAANQKIRLPLDGKAYKNGSTASIVTVLDSTP